MKTPDVIKKGLECISRHRMDDCGLECDKCDAYAPGWTTSGLCADALALIQQLEAELAAVKRERDAAVDGLCGDCRQCKYFTAPGCEEPCRSCIDGDSYRMSKKKWEWRGVLEGDQA